MISEQVIVDTLRLSDNELVTSILEFQNRNQVREYQHILYNRYVDRVYAKCISLITNSEIAKDLTHDIFVKVFINLNKFRNESPFFSWVFAITYNHCFNYLQKVKRIRIENLETYGIDYSIEEIEQSHNELHEIHLQQLEALITRIQESERIILFMRYWDGMSVKQIGEVLGIGESAVKMRIKRSRDHLADLLMKLNYDTER